MYQLDLMIIVPAVAAVLAALTGKRAPQAPRWIALAAVLGQTALLASLAGSGMFAGSRVLGAALGSQAYWRVMADGISTPLVVLTVFIGIVGVVASWKITERPGAYFALLLALQAAVTAVFLADSILMFYVAWESVLVPMFFLIGGWGSSNRRHAAAKFLIYTFGAGAVMLFGVILVFAANAGTTPPLTEMSLGSLSPGLQTLVFWLLMVGFLVKLPVVPVHTWLPDAHTEAPTAGSIVLAGVMLKMGGYGIMRLAMPLAPHAFNDARPALAIIGVVGIIYGAAMALTQSDLKRLVAYSSVSHMGFVVLALAVGTPSALGAAVLAMVSHGFVAGLLFLLVGSLYDRAHTRELSAFGGLGKVMPAWGVAFTFGALASLGLPGLSGFPGEFVAMIESFGAFGWWTVVITIGLVLGAAYNLRAWRSAVTGPVGGFAELPDLSGRELGLVAMFSAAIVVVGVQPAVVLSMAGQALSVLARAVGGGA